MRKYSEGDQKGCIVKLRGEGAQSNDYESEESVRRSVVRVDRQEAWQMPAQVTTVFQAAPREEATKSKKHS